MNILYVSDVYFPRINGVSTSIQVSAAELRRRGHHVELLVPRYAAEPAEPDVHRLPSRPVPFDPEDRLMSPRRALQIQQELDRRPPDLVHVHTPFVAQPVGRRLARRYGVPTVTTIHTHFEDYLHHYVPGVSRGLLRRLARSLCRRQAHAADAVVAPSRAIREVLQRYQVRVRIEVIPTGLPIAQLRGGDGAAFRARLGIARDRPVLVHVGRMAHEKNVEFLLQVVACLRRCRADVLLLLAGEGPARRSLERRVEALGIGRNVLFVGYLDRARELLDCYRAGDVFVFASRTETQGLVLLEAMALEVPVVSTAALGTLDVVGPGRGAVVAGENVGEFAGKVLVLLGDAGLRRAIGRDGRRWVEEAWSDQATVSALAELYTELATRRLAAA
jgi:glycosyltransferase involved in cell wall biosynthesis